MYRKLMWCYVFVLTLLDLSLNSKLTAQGKSHGVTVHDSLVEGITFQEWGSEAGGTGSGRALPPAALLASPPALALGRAPLGAAHAATVTLTNTANTTMHLASIAGTTPDFHASFFDSKTLACGANTSFSVVFLGRREGPVSQHLYIHTSLGVLKYPVSAVGVASSWGLWPLVGVRAPLDATLHSLLTMHNPGDRPVQVLEMYSSASWLGLQLPGGGDTAPREHWRLPPHSSRPLVRLRLKLAKEDSRTAYIRIKANVTGPPMVVVVEARATPAGAYAEPLQLRAGTRGARDSPYTFSISLGNSDGASVPLAGGAAHSCRAAPHAPPPHAAHNGAHHTHNGGGAEGVQLSMLRSQLEPHITPQPAAQLSLDFAALWAAGTEPAEAGAEAEEGAREERFCAGWAAVAGAAVPYSVRLVPGTLRLPDELHFVTSDDSCMRAQDIVARSEFLQPARVVAVEVPDELRAHFEVETWAGAELAAGGEARAARLTLRSRDTAAVLDARLTVLTNLTHTRYSVPVRLYSGRLHIEWQWPDAAADGSVLPLGTVGTSCTRRVLARVHNPAPAPVCARARPPPTATFELQPGGCIPANSWSSAVLTVVAPARAGPVRGAVRLLAAHADTVLAEAAVTLTAAPGAVRARLQHEPGARAPDDYVAAPWASGWAPALVVESTMALRMKLTRVEPQPPDPALVFAPPDDPESWWIGPGTSTIGRVLYQPEHACGTNCYTGLLINSTADWLNTPLVVDLELLAKRRALYETERLRAVRNVSLAIDTTEMVRIPVSGWVRMGWPRLVAGGATGAGGAGWAGLAGVGAGGARWLRVRNPAPHPLLLHASVAAHRPLPPRVLLETEECAHDQCTYVPGVFTVSEWRAVRGGAELLRAEGAEGAEGSGGEGPALLLAPRAEVELKIDFMPPEAELYGATLYLRNNLTIVEALQLGGQGSVPSFELGGRRAHSHAPIMLQVPDCEGEECTSVEVESDGEGGRWQVRRSLVARNTGAVPLRLRGWRLAGAPCAARGFRLEPCGVLQLQPNESRALTLAFHTDCSLARVSCPLTLRSDSGPAAFRLVAAVPAKLLPLCAKQQARPAWEPALRAIGALFAVIALALMLAVAALDAEKLLRRARDARQTPAPRAPLDLRALAREVPVVSAPAAPRRRKPRRTQPTLDPAAERRAFEHWRAEMLRRDAPRAEDESSRSSEDADVSPPAESPPRPSSPPPEASDTEPDTEEQPRSSGESDSSPAEEAGPPPPPPRTPPPPERAGGSARPAARRDAGAGSPTRRADPPARPRPTPGKHHTRKDKVSKRRSERAPTAARVSPAGEPRAAAAGGAGAGAGVGAGSAPAPPLRWGASWSSVVAAGSLSPPPVPVRPSPRTDHSLFYFNDAHAPPPPAPAPAPVPAPAPAPAPAPRDDFAWRVQERSPFEQPRDYRVGESPVLMNGNNAYGTIGSPWAGGALWGAALRPPPGFPAAPARPPAPLAHPAPAPAPAAPPVRAFDPFHSLASIWAPAAFDWRAEPRDRRDN